MERRYDLIIVGAGPAGLSAAIYMARAKYRVLVVEKDTIGGQITITSEVVNYPGVKKTSGRELTEQMRQQASAFGAEFLKANVIDVKPEGVLKIVETSAGSYEAMSVLVAAGANPRKLGFAGEKEYQGRGIAYCATCDGEFFTGKDVFVIGGGFAAAEEAVFLTKYARQVTVVMRGKDFRCAQSTADEVKKHDKIKIFYETEVLEAGGDGIVKYARFKNSATGETWEHRSADGFGIFVFAGYVPATGFIKDRIELDENGYIITDKNQQTNARGIYAAGDICIKELRQVVTAVSDGAIAATAMEKYVETLYETHNLPRIERSAAAEESQVSETQSEGFLGEEIKGQLQTVFAQFNSPVTVAYTLDDREVSKELKGFLTDISELTDKVELQEVKPAENQDSHLPVMRFLDIRGNDIGVAFRGVPGGHEFNSFVMALYYAAGGDTKLSSEVKARVEAIDQPVNIKIIVSLSCTMCPGLVLEAQRLAAINRNIETEIFDMAHYSDLKDRYKIMSVPCMVINNEHVSFGKKDADEILNIIDHLKN